MQSTNANVRQLIKDYFRQQPDGLEVTAYVLDRIGETDLRRYDVMGKTFDQAKQGMGKRVNDFLDEMYKIVEHLDVVRVDAAKWPELATWVASYTQHRVDPTRLRL